MLLLYNCSRSGNLAADSANIVVNQGLMAFHLYQQPGNYDEGSCSITCVTWVWVVWQKKKVHAQTKALQGAPKQPQKKVTFLIASNQQNYGHLTSWVLFFPTTQFACESQSSFGIWQEEGCKILGPIPSDGPTVHSSLSRPQSSKALKHVQKPPWLQWNFSLA